MEKTLNAREIEAFENRYNDLEEYILQKAEGISASKEYHNKDHFIDVRDSTVRILLQMGINIWDPMYWNALGGAIGHDSGLIPEIAKSYLESDPKITHEKIGELFLTAKLPTFGYNNEETTIISSVAPATTFPVQNPRNLIEAIVCDADVDNFGRDDFSHKGDLLRRELASIGIIKTDKEWYTGQKNMLKSHNYHTEGARALRDYGKLENIKIVEEKLAKISQ
jgi:uncharacterized protein